MFLDEAQFIKNPTSLGSKAVKSIAATNRFALTGTPIENALSELWSIFDFVMPGFFTKYSRFHEEYEKPILKVHDEKKMKELRLRIQPFILRRMKKDVLKELPDKIETKRMAEMTAKQQKVYLTYLSRIQAEMRERTDLDVPGGRMQVLAALTRLRQISCHPATFMENYHGGSGKLELLMEILPEILEGGHSVIIFSQFTSMLDIIAGELKEERILFHYLEGATKPEKRREYVKSFNQGKVKVFLISLKAGGTGLNLTGADTVIHFDPWWNPAVEDQATDRAYRIGQKKKVQVIKLIMKDSIEEKIETLQSRKKMLSQNLIEAGEVFVNRLSTEELLELFGIVPDKNQNSDIANS
jgi:SNF2 family DNA or RNA helicase